MNQLKLPIDLAIDIPENHLVKIVNRAIERMNLENFIFTGFIKNMEISFKARFIQKAPIRVAVDSTCKEYKRASASFLKLEATSISDMRLINKVANNYQKTIGDNENEYNYANDIRNKFNKIYNVPAMKKNENFYILTTEKVNEEEEIEGLDSDKVLGVAQVNDTPEETTCELKYLQVDPATNYRANERKYRGAGEAIWKSIEKLFPKNIFLKYDNKALGFYLNQNFEGFTMDKLIHEHNPEVVDIQA